MQRAACQGDTTYQIFLDLGKAYDSIHREAVLELMEKYGVGPNIWRYVANIWEDQKVFCKQGGFFSAEIDVERGVTQGDVDSPVIFNLIVDAVLRKIQEEEEFGLSEMCFYADDGLLEHTDPVALQCDVDRVVVSFS